MMTEHLQPANVFRYFEELCRIPHPSYQLEAIGAYLMNFAEEHGLQYWTDTDGNVVIIKSATQGYEYQPAVILQGHMDMVAVRTAESEIDPETEGLKLCEDNGYLYAEGTSLGGDDGIAIAYILAILDSDEISHPRIEAVFTTNEEVGMEGALGIDMTNLRGKRLLNIDSEEEGVLLAGCAGGIRVHSEIPVKRELFRGKKLQIHVDGLLGGHSGTEIHKERGNSNCLMGRVLAAIGNEARLIDLQGGLKDNAIPRVTSAVLLVCDELSEERIENILRKMRIEFLKEFWGRDDGINITWAYSSESELPALTVEATKKVANYLVAAPNGVCKMSDSLEGLVETSLNLGIVRLDETCLRVDFSLRSLITEERDRLQQQLKRLTAFFGGTSTESGAYPAWEYRSESKLRDKMVRIYRDCYGKEPIVTVIHAGLECGILAQKIEGLDCISFGPDILDIHTTEEKLDIASTERVWNYLLRVLADKEYPEEEILSEDSYAEVMDEDQCLTDEFVDETDEETTIDEILWDDEEFDSVKNVLMNCFK